MRETWRKIFGTAALAFMLCLSGLVISGEAQAQRFTDNGNGTVTDTVTGLMWTKDANMFGNMDWDSATSRCASLAVDSITGWRLPSMDEFPAIYKATRGQHPFEGIQGEYYWTSTHYTGYGGGHSRYSMHMLTGTLSRLSHKDNPFYVWCVRNTC
ncbi:DUF1566 domain-containing protein [Desulfonatronum sp. SC1]|uniref:Lcl C-terminal domain-containing protein n=1 Tax=Desulfonatronum sp. SC1 TaxID=2109626 RepID=UPI000D2FC7E1|nr:DUF1566 domain-containing protein [Desulfonatronum sp. SC1]PTN33611.1 hypothetical protein C6366_14330 [Desulfonatronum sp. SC1]